MKLPPLKALLANVLCLLALGWLYGMDLLDALRARRAEVSAFLAPPPVVWPAVVLAATAVALGVVFWGMWRGRGEGFKGYRLMPILLVSVLFVDLLRAEDQVLRSEEVAALSLRRFQEQAQALARGHTVPTDPAALRLALEGLDQPPYLVRGARVPAWSLQVRQDCQGPVLEAPGVEVGTFIYCVAPGGERAWVTLVALREGERSGLPSVLSVEGEPHVAIVQPAREVSEVGANDAVAPEVMDAGGMAPLPSP